MSYPAMNANGAAIQDSWLENVIDTGLVVIYAHPFVRSDPFPEPLIPPAAVPEFLAMEHRELHDFLIVRRHEFYAHTDADAKREHRRSVRVEDARGRFTVIRSRLLAANCGSSSNSPESSASCSSGGSRRRNRASRSPPRRLHCGAHSRLALRGRSPNQGQSAPQRPPAAALGSEQRPARQPGRSDSTGARSSSARVSGGGVDRVHSGFRVRANVRDPRRETSQCPRFRSCGPR